MQIHVIGPRDRNAYPGVATINTTSHSTAQWTTGLSPFFLGPVPLYDGRRAKVMENAWQFAKVYPQHVGAGGEILPAYWQWAQNGWERSSAVRYPMGKGAKPRFLLWGEERLGYIDARKRVYFTLYRDAVREQPAFRKLQELAAGQEIALWDFDGYDHERQGMSLADCLHYDARPMGHAFVLKMMLLYGPEVTPEKVIACEPEIPPPAAHRSPQSSLF
jgi:hypothetical protein